jgi:F0F1-type ATP synthase assembly protein I
MNDSMSNNNRQNNGYDDPDSELWQPREMEPTKTEPKVLLKLALMQLVSTVIFSVVLLFIFDVREGLSAFFGGFIAIFGSLYSAGRLFTAKQNADAVESLRRFYASIVIKIVFTLVMVAICVIVIKVSFLPFIIAYLIAAVVVNIMALWITA